MKILALSKYDWKPPFATEERLKYVLTYLASKGYKVLLLSSRFSNSLSREEINENLTIFRVGFPFSNNVYSSHIFIPSKILSLIRRFRPDFIYENIVEPPFFSPLFASSLPKVAICHHYTGVNLFLRTHKPPFCFFGIFGEALFVKLYRTTMVIVPSEDTKRSLLDHGFPVNLVTVIPNGVDLEKYYFSDEEASYPLILFIGRIVYRKGLHLLLRAMPKIVKVFPNIQLKVIGMVPDFGYDPRKLVESLGLDVHVEFLGHVDDREKILWLSKSWLVAVPSIMEGFGIVALEAASMGKPVVANNCLGLRNVILNGKTGLLTNAFSSDDLADRIVEVLSNRSLRRSLGRSARRWAENFSWEKTAEKELMLINRIARINRLD